MKSFVLLLLLLTTFFSSDAERTMGPVGKITLLSTYQCEDKIPGNEVTLNVAIKNIDDKGTKAAFGNATTRINVDPTIPIRLEIFKWIAGWKPFYDFKGKFCSDIPKYLGKVWEKLANALEPPIPKRCPYKPGTYILKNFQATSKDLSIPAIFYGRFLVKLTVTNQSGKLLSCIKGELDSQAPV